MRAHRLGPWLYLAPALLVLGFVFAYPAFQLVLLSLQRRTTVSAPPTFVGLANYAYVLSDETFWLGLKNNLVLMLSIPILVTVGLVVAVLLHERIRGWRFYRAIIFLPYVLPIPAVGLTFGYLLQANGPVNTALREAGLGFATTDWFGRPETALLAIMVVVVWKELGFAAILFLARLSSVPPDRYEAARLDGAGWIQELRFVSLPAVRPQIEFYVTLMVATLLSWVFAYVYVISFGGPGRSTIVTEFYVYLNAFRYQSIGVAAAASAILLAFACVFVVATTRLRRSVAAGPDS